MSGMEHHDKDNEQVFTRRARASYANGIGWPGQHESPWAAIVSIASKFGCAQQPLNEWIKKVEMGTGQRGGITCELAEKMKVLERGGTG